MVRKVGKDNREEAAGDVVEEDSAATVPQPHQSDICCKGPPRVLRNLGAKITNESISKLFG